MSERDFSFGGRDFKLNKIDAMKQFHVVRKIAPILSELLPAMTDIKRMKNLENLNEAENFALIAKFAGPIMMGLSKLSDVDAQDVLMSLLQSVEIKQAGNWARVASQSMLMFQDLELPALLQIAGRAFMYNLSSFFAVLPQ